MSKLLTINKNPEIALKEFLTFLLEKKKVSGVFSLRKVNENGAVDYGLITDKSHLDEIVPIHPLMPINAGQVLSRFTPIEKPIAAVIKPCEFRAFIELVKREQGTLDNFLLIGTFGVGKHLPMGIRVLRDECGQEFLHIDASTAREGGETQIDGDS